MYLIGCGMGEELSQVRSSRNLLEERMENELEQIRQELSDKEAIINEQRTTTEAQRRAFEEDLNLTRNQIETKEAALGDLRRLLEEERQQKTDLEERFRNLQLEMEEARDRHASTGRELNTAHQTRDSTIQRN